MADATAIEWTDATWNPVTGCSKVSQGCDHCYAETFAERWRGTVGHHFEQGFDVRLWSDRLTVPLTWTRPRRIFVNSMSDLFHEQVPDEFIVRVFAVMYAASAHTFQVLTKRPGRMRSLLNRATFVDQVYALATTDYYKRLRVLESRRFWPLPNVWLGVSAETDQWASVRIPPLIDTPAAVRFVSAEPLLGPVDLTAWLTCAHDAMSGGIDTRRWECDHCRAIVTEVDDPAGPHTLYGADGSARRIRREQTSPGRLLDWVIAGGESGPQARPMHPDWARSLRDQCTHAGVPFFFKQWGAWTPDLGGPGRTLPVWPQDRTGRAPEPLPLDGAVLMRRTTKKAAGRLLDGRTWDGYPPHPGAA